MNKLSKIILHVFFSVLIIFSTIAQEDDNIKTSFNEKIDPRRFVTISEFDSRNVETEIWSLECLNENCQEKKGRNYINEKSSLRIRFKHNQLAKEEQFYGNISVRAKVGNKDIEVPPYFLIGEKQKSYGVNSKPINEIASNFIKLFITSARLEERNEFREPLEQEEENPGENKKLALRDIRSLIETYSQLMVTEKDTTTWDSFMANDGVFMLLQLRYTLARYTDLEYPTSLNLVSEEYRKFRGTELTSLSGIQSVVSQTPFSSSKTIDRRTRVKEYGLRDAKEIIDLAKRTLQFMTFFKESGPNSMDAFLDISLLSKIEFESLHAKFSDIVKIITEEIVKENPRLDLLETELSKLRIQTYELNSYSTVICSKLIYTKNMTYDSISNISLDCNSAILGMTSADLSLLTKEFSLKAGEEIYNKLVYGTIDLSSISYSETDRIDISIIWYTSEEGQENGKTLPLASFYVKKMGWHLDIRESMQLTNRINAHKIKDPNYPLSPSVYKPTAGAAFLWTYFDSKKTGKRFLKWLEPSLGFNISYLDFNTEKDLEFGIGPVIGLFQNKIHITTGFNLNEKDIYPGYIGLGFSFSKVLNSIRDEDD